MPLETPSLPICLVFGLLATVMQRSYCLKPSMCRRGNCLANAVAASFLAVSKKRIRKHIYKTCDFAQADIFAGIKVFYNRTHRHSHLGGISPDVFERTSACGCDLSSKLDGVRPMLLDNFRVCFYYHRLICQMAYGVRIEFGDGETASL